MQSGNNEERAWREDGGLTGAKLVQAQHWATGRVTVATRYPGHRAFLFGVPIPRSRSGNGTGILLSFSHMASEVLTEEFEVWLLHPSTHAV